MAIALGGNIVLEGFESRDFTELIVVKKIVGQYARRLTDAHGEFSRLDVTLTQDGGHTVACTLAAGGKEQRTSSSAHNIYVALDDALKQLAAKMAR